MYRCDLGFYQSSFFWPSSLQKWRERFRLDVCGYIKFVYALFDEASGWVAVGVFDASPKADYNPLTDGEWLKKIHHVVKDALDLRTGESLGVFRDLLRGRLSSLASPYREELGLFIDMLGGG